MKTHHGLEKIAKGKYPIVEDEVGKTLASGGSVGGGALTGYKLANRFFKKGRIAGAFAGALGGAVAHNKLTGK